MKISMIKRSLASVAILSGLSMAGSAVAADCDPSNGQKLFSRCAACHTLTDGTHLMGPGLGGVVGRQAGAAEGYTYSLAMEQTGYDWTPERLDDFLKNPMTYVSGTVMPFAGLAKDQDRADLVCYLAQ